MFYEKKPAANLPQKNVQIRKASAGRKDLKGSP
jgi:hypothetical protein